MMIRTMVLCAYWVLPAVGHASEAGLEPPLPKAPGLPWQMLPGERVREGTERVVDRFLAMELQLDHTGFVAPPALERRLIGELAPARSLANANWKRAYRKGDVGCVVQVKAALGLSLTQLYGDCHAGSGAAYRRQAKLYRTVGWAGLGLGAVMTGVGVAALTSTSPEQDFGIPTNGKWWEAFGVSLAGMSLLGASPIQLALGVSLDRYGAAIDARHAE